MPHKNYDHVLKAAVFGVSNQLTRALIDKFGNNNNFNMEVPLEFIPKDFRIYDKEVRLHVWYTDTEKVNLLSRSNSSSSLNSFHAPYRPPFLKDLNLAIILYDMAKPDLDNIKMFTRLQDKSSLIVIAGVKSSSGASANADNIGQYARENGFVWRNSGIDITSEESVAAFFEEVTKLKLKKLHPDIESVSAPAPVR